MRRWGNSITCVVAGLLAAGCPKGNPHYSDGRKAEDIQDYDAALAYYQKALAAEPNNANYRIKINQMRFEASESHVKKGVALRDKGELQAAAAEFQRAQTIDPSSPVAMQELRKTLEHDRTNCAHKQDELASGSEDTSGNELASAPPEIKPLPNTPISLKMVNDVKIVFDTIGKLAGVTVTYDPDFPARRISVDLNNLTLQQALEIVCMQSKTFWKPITENIICHCARYHPEAQGLRRTIGRDFLSFKYRSVAGLDGNRQRLAPGVEPDQGSAAKLAERHHRSRHSG